MDLRTFLEREHELENVIRKRASHVVSENARTLSARSAMDEGDAVMLGQLMIASHISLRDDFEVSSPALDAIVDCANAKAACYGARMTGAGFGGCAVALVKAQAAAEFAECVRACYRGSDGKRADHLCHWREPRSGNDLSLIGDPFSEKCV